MLTLPRKYDTLIAAFAPIVGKRVWPQVLVLVVGAILAPGKRTVTSALRIMGLSDDRHFQNYHRVLNRAVWSSLAVSQVLLGLLVSAFASVGTIVIAMDDTIERRRGAKIKAKGIYRDPIRSSRGHFVKASGLRWLSLMLLVPIPWAKRVWALPFLTVLAPSERYYKGKTRAHKKLTDWARQVLLQMRRWLLKRKLVVVADSSFAVIELLERMQRLKNPICMVTRFRLDAALYEPAPERKPGQRGRPRKKGARLPTLEQALQDEKTVWQPVTIEDWYGEGRREVEIASGTAVWFHNGKPPLPIRWVLIRDAKGKFKPQALLCTDQQAGPVQILQWFVMRWQEEVTFREVRTHLGVETQRQWSDLAIARTTPALLGLFSLVTLLADQSVTRCKLPIRQAAWYSKQLPTFSDALAVVRDQLWQAMTFHTSPSDADMAKVPRTLLKRFTEALCYAA
ncbi:MAG: IS701 family transposase [Anaerolineae bacterium]